MVSMFRHYYRFILRFKKEIIIFWMIMLGVGAWFGPLFFKLTKVTAEASPGSQSAKAREVYRATFPERSLQNQLVVVLHSHSDSPNATVLGNYTKTVHEVLASTLPRFSEENDIDDPVFQSIGGYYSYWNDTTGNVSSKLAWMYVTPDQKSTIIPISYTNNQVIDYSVVNQFTRYLQDVIDNLPADDSEMKVSVGATGQDMLFDDTQRESESDFIAMDSIVLPASMFVLALYLRNLRLMIIPVLATATSLLVSFLVMWVVAKNITVASFAPSVMVSLVIAMSIDYSLFLLTRYREEILRGAPPVVAVRHMTKYAGHVVLLSGSTLTITFLGLIFFPLNILQSIGIGCALALIISLIVNMTLTPAMLLTFDVFFSQFHLLPKKWDRKLKKWWRGKKGSKKPQQQKPRANGVNHNDLNGSQYLAHNAHLNGLNGNTTNSNSTHANGSYNTYNNTNGHNGSTNDSLAVPLIDNRHYIDSDGEVDTPMKDAVRSRFNSSIEDLEAKALHEQNSSWWFKAAEFTTTTKWAIVTVILAVGAISSVAWKCVEFHTTPDNILVFPDNSRALATFRQMTEWYPPGTVDPYNIIVTAPKAEGVLTQEFYDDQFQLAKQLVDTGLVPNTSITSITSLQGNFVPFEQARFAVTNPDFTEDTATYASVYHQLVNQNQTAALMIVITSIDPNGYGTTQWIDDVRGVLSGRTHSPDNKAMYNYYLAGGATYNLDIMRSINKGVPVLVGVTATVLFLIVGFIFQSALVPIRQLFTIGLSICFVYGLAAFVFQDLNLKNAHGIYWMELVMTFSILVGLGLDYDVFLFSRVMEYRKLGYTNRASITKAIYRTGPIITAAGLIMALAFGGLMLSRTVVMIQFGFMLCFAVLLDTFVVRTLLVPALLHLSGDLNWWPQRLPPAIHDATHFGYEEIEQDFAHHITGSPTASPEPPPDMPGHRFDGLHSTLGSISP